MITKTSNSLSNLKNLWIEMFIDKTNKVTNVADGSILNATAYGTAKVAQKAIKDIAIVESQIFPESATGALLDKSAALFGVPSRKGALGSSTYVRVMAAPGTIYGLSTYFIAKNGTRFIVDKELVVDASGYGYVSVRSTVTGSATNVEANSITQVTPRPLTHIDCVNEYQAVGGRDFEDDETFRTRIKNNDNKLSKGTVEYWTQIFQDLDPRVLRVMNVGLGEDAKTHIYLVTQNGSFFTEDELSILLSKAKSYFGLFEIDLTGNSIGIVLENAEWMYIGGPIGVDFRVELSPGSDITTVRKNIQIALTKYLDFRFWTPGKIVQWDDLLQVVKTATGVKYVPDEFFNPFYDETVPSNQLPRIRGFIMRDLNGLVLFDAGVVLSNIFYPAGDSNIYMGQQSQILSQTQSVRVTVTNTRGAAVDGAVFSVGDKIVITNSEGQAQLLLENGEYDYVLSKNGWDQQTGNFIVLNANISIIINNFSATLQLVSFTVLQVSTPIKDVMIAISNQSLTTNAEGKTQISLEPGTYSYSLTKSGLAPVLNAVIVDTQSVNIVEYMFPQAQPVSFSVIDRERNIFVPDASIWIQDMTEVTNQEGQAELPLNEGSYKMIVQRPRYIQYEKTIDISSIEKNCILVELEAIPYQVSITVLSTETSLPISGASILINGSSYSTDGKGIAMISLADGTYPFEVIKSGYSQHTGTILVDGETTGVVVRMHKAFWKTTFIVRDIDTGIFLQGALVDVNGKSALTDINGEAEFLLDNGTFPYEVSLAEFKTMRGDVVVLDEEPTVNIFMPPADRKITFIAKDFLTKEVLAETSITVKDSGTGAIISTVTTNSEGKAIADVGRGSYNYTASRQLYFDSTGTFDVDLQDFEIEVLMKIKPVQVDIRVKTEADAIKISGGVPEVKTEFTSVTTGEVFTSKPTDKYGEISILLQPDHYNYRTSGPGIVSQDGTLLLKSSQILDIKIAALTKEVSIYLSTLIPETIFPFVFRDLIIGMNLVRSDGWWDTVRLIPSPTTRDLMFKGYFLWNPVRYHFINSAAGAPLWSSPIFAAYYKSGVDGRLPDFYVDADSPTILEQQVIPNTNGILKIILKNDIDQYIPVGETFQIGIERTVEFDYPYSKIFPVTSINRDGIVMVEKTDIPLGKYTVTISSNAALYQPVTLVNIDLHNNSPKKELTVKLQRNKVTIAANISYLGFPLASTAQIIDKIPGTILAGPSPTVDGFVSLEPYKRSYGSSYNVLPGPKWSEYFQDIGLTTNQTLDIELESLLTESLKGTVVTTTPNRYIYPTVSGDPVLNFAIWGDGSFRESSIKDLSYRYNLAGEYLLQIYSLSGKIINLRNCELTTLDVSKNVNLISLSCGENNLTTLDVSKNVNLISLSCGENNLTTLDISKNVNLADLDCNSNNLTTLDISKNVNLTKCVTLNSLNLISVTFVNSLLTYLDIASCPKILEIDPSTLKELDEVYINGTSIKLIDFSFNTKLRNFYFSEILTDLILGENLIKTLNFAYNSRGLERLTVKNNSSISSIIFEAAYSPSLKLFSFINNTGRTSIVLSKLPVLTDVDITDSNVYSIDCSFCPELKSITSAEPNSSLKVLKAQNSGLTSLDTSNMNLKELYVDNLKLPELNLDKSIDLASTYFSLKNVNIGKFSMTNNRIINIYLSYTEVIQEIKITNNSTLSDLDISSTGTLILNNCSKLRRVVCGSLSVGSLDLKELPLLKSLSLTGAFTSIDISSFLELTYIFLRAPLTSIDISQNSKLEDLSITSNNLASIDIKNNIILTECTIRSNIITSIDARGCSSLKSLILDQCSDLKDVEIATAIKLEYLNLGSCDIYQLYLPPTDTLTSIEISKIPLVSTDGILIDFANRLFNRTGLSVGSLTIYNPTQQAKIQAICDAKNWQIK